MHTHSNDACIVLTIVRVASNLTELIICMENHYCTCQLCFTHHARTLYLQLQGVDSEESANQDPFKLHDQVL